jgi:hypothetical protein
MVGQICPINHSLLISYIKDYQIEEEIIIILSVWLVGSMKTQGGSFCSENWRDLSINYSSVEMDFNSSSCLCPLFLLVTQG